MMETISKYKNLLIGILILIVGIFLGTLFSGDSNSSSSSQSEQAHDHKEQTWTCSMHPQIRSGEAGSCPICGMDLIPLEEMGGMEAPADVIVLSEAAAQLANIQTSRVGRSDAEREIRLLGTVKPDESRLYSQVSHLPGRIERLYVNFTGEYIRSGQRIVRLYSPELISAQMELFEAIKSKDVYPQLYSASRSKLRRWKLSDAQIDNIVASGKVEEQIDILSDHAGYVMKRNVDVGDHVSVGMNLFEIANLDRVWIMFDAYERDIPWIRKGDRVDFSIQAVPGQNFTGKVSYIDPFVSAASRVAKVRIEVNNKEGNLLPEMFANGVIHSRVNLGSDALVIPKSAVLWTGKRGVVYVRAPGSEAFAFRYREVELGADLGDFYVVVSGLEEGEEIATNGVFRIDASAQLSGRKSMMNPEGGESRTAHDHAKSDPQGRRSRPAGVNEGLPDHSSEVAPGFKQQLGRVIETYMQVKNNLVLDREVESKKASEVMRTELKKVDMKLARGEAHEAWMTELKLLEEALDRMSEAQGMEELRAAFSDLSDALSQSAQAFGWSSEDEKVIYLEFCPMANQDKGGYWLSFEEEIRNPYFGDRMLQCGEVVRKLEQ